MKRTLTDKQSEIIYKKQGLFTVLACPGSGKTFTVSARLHRLLCDWKNKYQGIATISFTNVAWEEIEEYLVRDFGMDSFPGYPHFLGTIDSFINTYIFLPFGHLTMGCAVRPTLSGPPHDNHEPIGSWLFWKDAICNSKGCRLNQFSYNHNGELIHLRHNGWGAHCPHNAKQPCVQHKKTFNSHGYATQADANYFALKILRDYPQIADALAKRFPTVMVDEAQDTSRIQMDILDLLIKHGVQEMMLVGDPNQAIYEWREAEPRLFLQKYEEWKENSVTLTENWRSSQRVCDFASKLSSQSNKMRAANPSFKDAGVYPEIWGYSDLSDLPKLMDQFIRHCNSFEIGKPGANILTRGTELLNEICPGTIQPYNLEPWSDSLTRGLALSKYHYDKSDFGKAFHLLQRELCKCRLGERTFKRSDLDKVYNEEGFANWRAGLFEVLSMLPTTDKNLSNWVRESNQAMKRGGNICDLELKIKSNSSKCRYGELSFKQAFGQLDERSPKSDCYLGTAHSVKGKSLDAVMLVLRKKAGRSAFYVKLLGNDIQQDEELQIIYVAVTRAKYILTMVVPSEDLAFWNGYFSAQVIENAII